MPTSPTSLTDDDLQTLARFAGLHIAPEREASVLAELNSQRANLRLLETLLPASKPAAALPYDPTFPPVWFDDDEAVR